MISRYPRNTETYNQIIKRLFRYEHGNRQKEKKLMLKHVLFNIKNL